MHTSYEKIKETLNNASGLDIKYVRFTGGEPLLRKDLLKILKYAKTKGFYIFLNTNATLLDNTIIKHLEKYVDNILVSLCGYSAYTEAIINSESGFIKNKFRNILKLRKSKIPHIRIGTVISKILIDNFDKYSILIKALGINDWELYRPMLPPAKMAHLPDYNIGKNDLFKLFRLIRRLRKKGINVYIANAIPFCIAPNNTYKPIMRGAQFDDGHRRLVLDPEGFFKPSYFIRENLGKNISKAWKHNLIRKINACDYLPYKCNHCIYLRWCLGGSRYMAKEYCGSYFAHDPLMAS
jgi:radical SAM protein with 4Fe4S-binding SPASM domain